jgi:hypothetical protein
MTTRKPKGLGRGLDDDGKAAIGVVADLGRDPLGDFLLKHPHYFWNLISVLQTFE